MVFAGTSLCYIQPVTVLVSCEKDDGLTIQHFRSLLHCNFCFVAKLVPVGYGIKKLQITCVIEDDKVGTEDLEEKITAFEDLVSSG